MKSLVRLLFLLPALPLVALWRAGSLFIGKDRALTDLSEFLALAPGLPGVYLRAATYRLVLRKCSSEVHVGFGTVLSKTDAEIGDHVYIGRYASLGLVRIEKDVMLADFVAIPSGGRTHIVEPGVPPRMAPNTFTPVRIGEGAWIGTGAIVMADVGEFSMVGAGSVVTRPVPPHSKAYGVPARVAGDEEARR